MAVFALVVGVPMSMAASEPKGPKPAVSAGDRLVLSLHSDRLVVGPKDTTLPLVLVALNTGRTNQAFRFSTGQRADFVVESEGKVVWKWSVGKMFTQALGELSLPPLKPVVFVVVWNLTDNEGRRVLPGRYQIRGVLSAREPVSSQPLNIEIR